MNNHFRQRTSPRLQGYDYAQGGAYFVTICTHNREHIFGSIQNGNMSLNEIGQIALTCWNAITDHFASVELDVSVVMPNHVHGIIVLSGGGAALGTIVGNYKAAVTRQIRNLPAAGTPYMASPQSYPPDIRMTSTPTKIWQARYHDHVIRNESLLQRIQSYIVNNPALWHEDTFFTPS